MGRIRLLALATLLSLGCTQFLAAWDTRAPDLEARGPGKVFTTIEAAAIDALTYAYLQGYHAGDAQLLRGGTIYATRGGYSYDEVHVANPLNSQRIAYTLRPRDVARFHIYPRVIRHDVNRANERPSQADRRSVVVTDPLQRPLYILHPSLVIREYHGSEHGPLEVADLTHKAKSLSVAAGY